MWPLNLFTRKPVTRQPAPRPRRKLGEPELPFYVAHEIDSAYLSLKAPGESGHRVLCGIEGVNPFIYTDEGGARAVQRLFPELEPEEQDRAARRLRRRVKKLISTYREPDPCAPPSRRWMTDY